MKCEATDCNSPSGKESLNPPANLWKPYTQWLRRGQPERRVEQLFQWEELKTWLRLTSRWYYCLILLEHGRGRIFQTQVRWEPSLPPLLGKAEQREASDMNRTVCGNWFLQPRHCEPGKAANRRQRRYCERRRIFFGIRKRALLHQQIDTHKSHASDNKLQGQ